MTTYGLIGHPLGHSFSKEVHEAMGKYKYRLLDLDPQEMKDFLAGRNFRGLSVTIPYKQAVIEFCDKLTDRAKSIGAVNTLYWEEEAGERILVGHNTDYDGFLYTAKKGGIDFDSKTVLILGTGGTSKTACAAAEDNGAKTIYFASREKGGTVHQGYEVIAYDALDEVSSRIDIIVNTTPVGMYPGNLEKPVSLKSFPNCRGVIDVIYNPLRTALIMEAEELGIKTATGLPMIVAQATAAAEKFLGKPEGDKDLTGRNEIILEELKSRKENIVLIGMPGCGKTTYGKTLARETGRTFVDLDREVEVDAGKTIPEIFEAEGEKTFRRYESEAAGKWGKEHGLIIATGGGIVTGEENYRILHQNGRIIWLKRPLTELPVDGRPLSQGQGALEKIAEERMPLYEQWADEVKDE